ncbi:MAG: hypothetical protein ACRDUA_07550, partial [Micromonosporaceae bacterium]
MPDLRAGETAPGRLCVVTGQTPTGTVPGAVPISSANLATRRRPTIRYAGPPPRGPSTAPGSPDRRSAATTAGQVVWSVADSPST